MKTALIALSVFIVDYALQGAYMCIEILKDRWYERPPGEYVLAHHEPSRTARLLGALVAINLTLALLYAVGTPMRPAFADTLLAWVSGS